MRKAILALVLGTGLVGSAAQAQDWQPVAPGVDLLEQNLPGPRRVKVLRVGLCTPGLRMRATAYEERGQRTSAWAPKAGVVAAINGGFFVPGDPTRGEGIAAGGGAAWPGVTDPDYRGFIAFGPNVLRLSGSGEVLGPPEPWVEEAVNGDATLVINGEPAYGHGGGCPTRNPLTAVGLSADNATLWMVTVDGRQTSSIGMTCNEMTDFMMGLGAHNSLKLDGGGSTSMWVQGRGLVNSPSDASGERTVNNHLGIVAAGSGPPRSCMTRDLPTIVTGVKRALPPQGQIEGWKFSLVDLIPLADDWLLAYPDGEPLPAGPPVIVAEDKPEGGRGFLLEGGRKRLIPTLYELVTWRFHEQTIQKRSVAELAAIPDGAPVTGTPVLMYSKESGAFLIDVPKPELTETDNDSNKPEPVDGGGEVSGLCTVSLARHNDAAPAAFAMLLLGAFLARRRSR